MPILDKATTDSAEKLTKSFVAGEAITKLNVVRLGASQEAFKGTKDDTYVKAKVVGVALADAAIGESVEVQLFGVLEDPSFSISVNEPVFLGNAGAITGTATSTIGEFQTIIAQSLGIGAIFINIEEPLELL